jgi:hypothetical protein
MQDSSKFIKLFHSINQFFAIVRRKSVIRLTGRFPEFIAIKTAGALGLISRTGSILINFGSVNRNQ